MLACTCGHLLTIKQNGIGVVVLDDNNEPYKMHMADLWICPGCGSETLKCNPLEAYHRGDILNEQIEYYKARNKYYEVS